MRITGRCSAGISWWPAAAFRFSAPPDREPQAGVVTLLAPTASSSQAAGSGHADGTAAAAAAEPAAASSTNSTSSKLHLSFTRPDAPDEVEMGASLMGGCLPFPFIRISTKRLEGVLDPVSGAITLDFEAEFLCGFGKRRATALPIHATLTTETARAFRQELTGERLSPEGHCVLVSAAEVPKTAHRLANLLLWLPTAATARLPVRLEFR